jgi:hypothetical protein
MTEITREQLDDEARGLGIPGPEHYPNKESLETAIEAALAARNPALEPDPVAQPRRTYKVVGPRPVRGVRPGRTFTAVLPVEQESALLEAGHIQIQRETP